MIRAILNTLSDLSIALFLLSAGFLFKGCENTVEISERVVYTDGTPVKGAKVRQWTNRYNGSTITNNRGEWSLFVPADTIINLCIEDPKNHNKEACYEMDSLLTPQFEGGNEMLRLD